jgi:phage terminase small subunit
MSMKNAKPRPPKHLRPSTKLWWSQVVLDFSLDEHHLHLLTAACECLDRAAEAREIIDVEGPYFTDRHGARKPHPALQVERDSKALFSRLLRELALDVEAPMDPRRPPALGGYERR